MTINGAGNGSRKSMFSLQYPIDLAAQAATSYFYIRVVRKVPRPLNTFNPLAGNEFTLGGDVFGNNLEQSMGQIVLPMPLGVADANNADWADGTFNFLEGQAANAISNIFSGASAADSFGAGFESLSAEAKKFFTDLTAQLQNAGINNSATTGVAASILKTFGSNITPNQLLSRNTGQILNPNLELLFNGPTLRNHEFAFKLTPRSKRRAISWNCLFISWTVFLLPRISQSSAELSRRSSAIEIRNTSSCPNWLITEAYKSLATPSLGIPLSSQLCRYSSIASNNSI